MIILATKSNKTKSGKSTASRTGSKGKTTAKKSNTRKADVKYESYKRKKSGKNGKSGKTDKTDSIKSSDLVTGTKTGSDTNITVAGTKTDSGTDITVTTPKALIALLLMGGSGDAMSKIYEELGSSDLNEHFLLYTFISAIILCTMAAVWSRQGLTRDDVLFGCLIGIPNFYTARFLLAALAYAPAVIVYPTYSTGTIIFVSIAGVLIFHEKITPKQKTAILMILAALILLYL
jgi:multidrug transporter EmrE-like cation transporter